MYRYFYGTFENKIDITEKVTEKDNCIIIPSGDEHRNNLYGDPVFGRIKSIFIEHPDSTLSKFTHEMKITIKNSVITTEKNVIIVYYIYINPERNWKAIVGGQLEDLKTIQFNSPIHIHICSEQPDLIDECKHFIHGIRKKDLTIYSSTENQYEYPGIKLLYDLSQQNPESIFFYMHTKGMVRTNSETRSIEELRLFRSTIYYQNIIQDIFKNENINKVGLMPAESGFMWYNFFYVRGSYLTIDPEISPNRFYYEGYLSLSGTNYLDCYSLLEKCICYYTSVTADNNLLGNGYLNELSGHFDKT